MPSDPVAWEEDGAAALEWRYTSVLEKLSSLF
jgi:hypothetical protein